MKLFKYIVVLTIGCSLALSGCAKKPETKAEVVDPQTGLTKMIAHSDELKADLQSKDAKKIKGTTPKLEDDWATFEDSVKAKFPDGYNKVETSLDPLISGAKQSSLDFALLGQLNDELNAALKQLNSN
ncbi:MAG: hypothetical protein JWM44_3366 [Bacilli bacterium]|nr:hypothetical protein [Bacilli bacterium]